MCSKIFRFVAAVVAVTLVFWLGGFDFNERGWQFSVWFLVSLYLGSAAAYLLGDE
jgi:hypothetical protein